MDDGISSFWGPVTSTIECCEKNYVYSSYIAEFFNTISNVPGIILALIGLISALRQRFEKRFSFLHISNMALAIGNMLYHATLQRVMYKYYIHTSDNCAKWLAKFYLLTLLLGSLCWFVDREFCKKFSSWDFNPQGHAFWHLFMGLNSYLANTFLMFCRAQQLEWDPKVARFMGVLPYVKIHKSKTR